MKIRNLLLPMSIAMALGGCMTPQKHSEVITEDVDAANSIPHQQSSHRQAPLVKTSPRPVAAEAPADSVQHGISSDVWTTIADNLGFAPDIADRRVKGHMAIYAHNQPYFDETLKQAELYLPYVLEQVLENNMPAEIALLPFIESAYDPFAHSASGAAGLWQIIPATGDHLKLRRNPWYDGRRDLIRSTDAAINYLTALHQQFDGDWLLTLAAYNAGPGTIKRAQEANERQGKPADFWSLELAEETTSFVPKLIALTKVISEPDRFGVDLLPIAEGSTVGVVRLDGPLNLNQAALLADISTDELQRLNPGYTGSSTPPSGSFHLVLPEEVLADFKDKLAALPPQQRNAAEQGYRVARGDTLSGIAKKHRLSTSDLAVFNGIDRNSVLRIGQVLRIPGGTASAPANGPGSAAAATYEVRSGDSLWKIARSNNVSVNDLLAWNNLPPSARIRPGQVLKIKFYN